MYICGHIISKNEIIGIGPLMVKFSNDQAVRMLYNSKQLSFYLHLKNHSIKIESDWLDLGTAKEPNDAESKARAEYNLFKRRHEDAVGIVTQLLDDLMLLSRK